MFVCLFKQKTAYEMRISDWSSDVCSADLPVEVFGAGQRQLQQGARAVLRRLAAHGLGAVEGEREGGGHRCRRRQPRDLPVAPAALLALEVPEGEVDGIARGPRRQQRLQAVAVESFGEGRSEEHTSELQSLMRISYAVFCLKKKTRNHSP